MTIAKVPVGGDVVTYAAGARVLGCGRVADAMHTLTGWSVKYCQKVLGEGREVHVAAQIIEAHIVAQDLGATFIERIQPIELAMARIPAETYTPEIETVEQRADAAANLEQLLYIQQQTAAHASRRIRSNNREIAVLLGVNRALASRHGLTL